jgi:hypothetical protein
VDVYCYHNTTQPGCRRRRAATAIAAAGGAAAASELHMM